MLLALSDGAVGASSREWRRVPDGPGLLDGHGMAYDSESDRTLVLGGIVRTIGDPGWNPDVWSYDVNTRRWETRALRPEDQGPSSSLLAAAYDAESDKVVTFPPTMAYDLNTNDWTSMGPTTEPPYVYQGNFGTLVSSGFTMTYDTESDRVIMSGGTRDYGCYADTWSYDYNSNTWTRMAPGPNVNCPIIAYDAESDRVILFGGWEFGSGRRLSPTWSYDLNTDTWSERSPGVSPEARTQHAMVYDASWDRIILYGGETDSGGWTGDTWTYDQNSNAWDRIETANEPPRRRRHAMAYDAESQETVLFGGDFNSASVGDTWVFGLGAAISNESPLLAATAAVAGVVAGGLVFIILRRFGKKGEDPVEDPNRPPADRP